MKKENDPIIEELWRIKDNLSASCDHDLKKLIKHMKYIAENLGFHDREINLPETMKTTQD